MSESLLANSYSYISYLQLAIPIILSLEHPRIAESTVSRLSAAIIIAIVRTLIYNRPMMKLAESRDRGSAPPVHAGFQR